VEESTNPRTDEYNNAADADKQTDRCHKHLNGDFAHDGASVPATWFQVHFEGVLTLP
jgi:hypothetical protein